ncbi:hypothetical protein [Crenothrix polyspora]|uniref:Uncharacterized protein n=1 Tax=Crenothrix polyspora TaxID=360316 RepID=A0A1R4HI28_9GAMM|nr:hypothetical protein [Crenothrix polyspora]SJM95877.1 conserved hypothetical protein [Crenothrix polyspora]
MADRRDIKFEIVDHRRALQKISPHHDLVKPKRWRVTALLAAMAVVIALGFAVSPDDNMETTVRMTKHVATPANPVLSSEINNLKGQFVGLISGSIENKLKTLEDNIRVGAVSNSLGTIQDLKNDVKVLRAYSQPSTPENSTVVSNAQLMKEMSHLRNLIYLTLSSCGLMIAAIAGTWIKNRKQLPFKKPEVITRYLGKH